MLNDPLIEAMMRADGVDPDELGAELARIASREEIMAEPADLPLRARGAHARWRISFFP